jgi:hypothetical protein
MEKLARSYIETRIQKTRSNAVDSITEILSEGSGKSQAEHAREEAQKGFPTCTASYLYRDTTLSVSQKGEILAEAYTKNAQRSEDLARYTGLDERAAKYRREAQQSKRIAQGLTRAAQRSQNS